MLTILLFVLVSTACFYLGSRAVITRFLWSRYPSWLASFMDCAACSGFWYGLGLAIVWGQWRPLPFDLPLEAAPLVGLCSMVWTPFGAAMMQRSIDDVGTAVAPVGEPLDLPVEPVKVEIDPIDHRPRIQYHHTKTESWGYSCSCGETWNTSRDMTDEQIISIAAKAQQHAAVANRWFLLHGGG